jgi:acetylornithine deacetylase/succinyl-diaminopimelate desuccinylase-like protein
VRNRGGYNPERTPIDHPLVRTVLAAARAEAAGGIVVTPTMGGSLPLYLFREVLDAPTVTLALANHDNNQHAEDENLRLGNLWEAIAIAAAVMRGD